MTSTKVFVRLIAGGVGVLIASEATRWILEYGRYREMKKSEEKYMEGRIDILGEAVDTLRRRMDSQSL